MRRRQGGRGADAQVADPPRKGRRGEGAGAAGRRFLVCVGGVSLPPPPPPRGRPAPRATGYGQKRRRNGEGSGPPDHAEWGGRCSSPKKARRSIINVKVEFGEGEGKVPLDNIAKRAEAYKPKERVTYKMIKEYIEAKYGFKVHTAYIAEVKRDLGLPMYDAPNAVEELKQPRKHPTAEKVEAIKDALKHFEVI